MYPDYILNAPSNRVVRKEQLVALLVNGQIASESFETLPRWCGNIGNRRGRSHEAPSNLLFGIVSPVRGEPVLGVSLEYFGEISSDLPTS